VKCNVNVISHGLSGKWLQDFFRNPPMLRFESGTCSVSGEHHNHRASVTGSGVCHSLIGPVAT